MLKGLVNDLNLWEALSVVADLAEQTGYPGISKQLNALAHLCDKTPQPSNVPRYVAAKSIRPGDIIHVSDGGVAVATVDRSYADWATDVSQTEQVITLTNGAIMRLPNDWLLLVEPTEHTRDATLEKAMLDTLLLDDGLNDDMGSGWPDDEGGIAYKNIGVNT